MKIDTTSVKTGLVPVSDDVRTTLEVRVNSFVADLVEQNVNSPEFGKRVDTIINLGNKEISEAARQSNRFLDRPIKAMNGNSTVGMNLAELRRVIEDLDPGKKGNLLSPRKLFGFLPFGNNLQSYFDSYLSAQSHITSILSHLATGKDELLMDNAAIDVERHHLWETMGKLEQMIVMSQLMDTRLEESAAELDVVDAPKARAIRESALFYTRQRTQDLLTQMAISVQGYLALDQVKKNNVELVKGVDRASTTTVSALRTAVTVAQALTSQKLVLEQINSLNGTTTTLIESTGKMLKDNTTKINEQASSTTVPLETLQKAFQNIYDTIDSIDSFKIKSLDSMKLTVDTLSVEIDKAQSRNTVNGIR